MGLTNGLVVILVVRILIAEANSWSDDAFFGSQKNSNTSICTKLISHKVSQYSPYTEIFRSRNDSEPGTYKPLNIYERFFKSRLNYRLRFRTEWIRESDCCEGYVKHGALCKPRCPQSCKNGACEVPDVCVCNNGYLMSNNTENGEELCVPICANGCINGFCIGVNLCHCNRDYYMDSDGFTCRPMCHIECEQDHGYCRVPYICSCRSGYRSNNGYLPFKCEPVCDRACTNGYCTAPNICKCMDGYEANEFDPRFTCKPKCSENCIFGMCTAPEICTCDNGYKPLNASVCEPICSESCVMGTCVAPESCSCNEGYGLRNSKYICEPFCEIDCGNGTCTAPGICTCDVGFIYDNQDRTCKPHCEIPCGPNSECTSPNNCTCFNGYRLSSAILISSQNATPFQSKLDKAYDIGEFQSLCQPICDFDCINGTCTAPNVCTCNVGYHPSWIESYQQSLSFNNSAARICVQHVAVTCNVSCGSDEMCTTSGICTCSDGYTINADSHCVPFCAETCFNGVCAAPNRCTCNDGFAPRNESFCEPICEKGCQNGDCVGPNHCVCHNNFVLNTEYHSMAECIPECTRNCSDHGVCIIGNEYSCKCHFGWAGLDCDQPTMCVTMIDFDHNDINRITIHNDTNSTIMQAHENAPYCYQCDNFLNNESLCYVVLSDEANTTSTIGCLFSTDLPCYMAPRYNASTNTAKIVWPFVAIALLIATTLTVAVYLMYRRQQRKKLTIADMPTNYLTRESSATESLLTENVDI